MWCPEDTMAEPSYILFHKSLLQCRSIGARGGRAFGRNQLARRALVPTPPAALPLRAPPAETTATAIALLDARFPWLRCAERRLNRSRPPPLRLNLPGRARLATLCGNLWPLAVDQPRSQ